MGKTIYQFWECKCDCGNTVNIRSCSLTSGETSSCGCISKELLCNRNAKHNGCGTVEYRAWNQMKNRCYNPNDKFYKDYGGRGIKVCERWNNSFPNFLEDMGLRPTVDGEFYSLDRIDNNGDYCPENCRWATRSEQANNKRNTVFIECNGETKTVKEWSMISGIPRNTLVNRLKTCSSEIALNKPILTKISVIQINKKDNSIVNKFESVAEAARTLNIGQRGIFKCIQDGNERFTSGGFKWRKCEEDKE